MLRALHVGLAICILVLLVSCSARDGNPDPGGRAPAPAPGLDLPALPAAGDYSGQFAARRDAADYTATLTGIEAASYNEHAVPDTEAGTMQLSAPVAGSAWALYRFGDIQSEDTPSELEITLAGSRPDVLWVGLSDYGAGAWQWQAAAPETSVVTVSLTGLEQPVDAGVFHVLVVTHGGREATLWLLRLELAGYPPTPPTDVTVDEGPGPGQFTLDWVKAEGADGYEVYRDNTSSAYASVGDVASWTDTATGDEDHTYWLRSVNQHGAGGLSQPAFAGQEPWQIQLIDPDGRYSTSLAVVDGKPVIAYVAVVVDMVTTPYPRFARATTSTPSGADDWVITEWNQWGDAVNSTHIPWVAELDGKPAFTIVNRYYRALTASPSSREDWEMHLFDAEADINSRAPLIEFGSIPYILYIDSDIDTLRIARAHTAVPSTSSDWDLSDIDTWEMVQTSVYSLNVIDGRLAVCYGHHDSTFGPGELKFAHATSAEPQGKADWEIHLIEELPDSPSSMYTADLIALANGKPAISYIGSGKDYTNLRFARAVSAAPESAADWIVTVIDPDIGWIGMGTAMALFEDKPNFSMLYNYEVHLARSTMPEPSMPGDWYFESVESNMSGMGFYKDLEVINGQLTIAYCSSGGLFMATRD